MWLSRGPMNATLLDLPIETPETLVSCVNCPAVQRLERALEQLKERFPPGSGYWKSPAKANSLAANLFDPDEATATAKKRGAQPGHAGHPRALRRLLAPAIMCRPPRRFIRHIPRGRLLCHPPTEKLDFNGATPKEVIMQTPNSLESPADTDAVVTAAIDRISRLAAQADGGRRAAPKTPSRPSSRPRSAPPGWPTARWRRWC